MYKLLGLTGKEEIARITNAVISHLPALKTEDTTSILSSFAKIRHRDFRLFSALVEHLEAGKDIPLGEARVIIHSFSKIYFTNSNLTNRCADIVKSNVNLIRPKDACNLLHSFTRLRYDDPILLEQLISIARDSLHDLDDVSLANFAIGSAKSNVIDDTVMLICQEIKARSPKLGPLESLRALLALAHFSTNGEAVDAAAAIVKGLNCNLLSLLQLTLALEAVTAIGCEYADKIATALSRKRDSYTSVPHDLDMRIQAALKNMQTGRKQE
ncbi:hypothetical protein BgAZ_100240 [Babesia gibsoni]|uniref:Uncharacterized protein n=1 Tax=Babesia gibsoni TaxID=33632 RepID=A0AAD8UUM4_BABGI|nr:hypothetical protein BgAZ_100240 [Babesia gibsoni]